MARIRPARAAGCLHSPEQLAFLAATEAAAREWAAARDESDEADSECEDCEEAHGPGPARAGSSRPLTPSQTGPGPESLSGGGRALGDTGPHTAFSPMSRTTAAARRDHNKDYSQAWESFKLSESQSEVIADSDSEPAAQGLAGGLERLRLGDLGPTPPAGRRRADDRSR